MSKTHKHPSSCQSSHDTSAPQPISLPWCVILACTIRLCSAARWLLQQGRLHLANTGFPGLVLEFPRLTLNHSWELLPGYPSKTGICPKSPSSTFSEFQSPLAHPNQYIKHFVSVFVTSCPSYFLPPNPRLAIMCCPVNQGESLFPSIRRISEWQILLHLS